MQKISQISAACVVTTVLAGAAWPASGAEYLDLTSSARLLAWRSSGQERLKSFSSAQGAHMLSAEWDEERDIREIRVGYAGRPVQGVRIEYWFKNWPSPPPKMPSMEDPMDDPWQGKWLGAEAKENCTVAECAYTFAPLSEKENPNSRNLPSVEYRRTLKVRLVYSGAAPEISSLQIFSDSKETPRQMCVQFDSDKEGSAAYAGSVSIYNGRIDSVRGWNFERDDRVKPDHSWTFRSSSRAKGLVLDLTTAQPALAGSNDVTVVTVHAQRSTGGSSQDKSFSFATADLADGPIVIPDLNLRVTDLRASSAHQSSGKLRVRNRIAQEPEQTLDRASREIPALDPWDREWGGPVYMPLASDSSWQKFAIDYAGNIFISKSADKAKGAELKRLEWTGDRIMWKLGTGPSAYDRSDRKVSEDILEGYLPVVNQRWESAGFSYSQESFSTLLRGPLSPADAARNEQTPAVLFVHLDTHNSGTSPGRADIWLSIDPDTDLSDDGMWVRSGNQVRAGFDMPAGGESKIEDLPGKPGVKAVHIQYPVWAAGNAALIVKIPFVTDLSPADLNDLKRLSYEQERSRVIEYWEHIVAAACRFTVPEPKFNELAKAVIAHIHISTTKDPDTGLYIVPAASYVYDEFENESCYQVLLLDTLGQFDTAAEYLETILRLQGSENFPGLQTGPANAIFHGTKINDTYNYTEQGYGLDHGTVLWTLAQHYLYSRDRHWLEQAWPHMQRAIDWIVEQRSHTKQLDKNGKKIREYGLLPASQLEDNPDWANWFVINAYSWAGMALTAQALMDIGNHEAPHVQKEADEFLADLRDDILRAIEAAPVVRMQDGTYEPRVPVVPTRRLRLFGPLERDYFHRYAGPAINPLLRLGADRDTLCGPVLFLILGVFPPEAQVTRWILDDWEDNLTLSSGMGMNIHGMTDDRYWFSQGGMVFQANLVNPIPVYLRLHEPQSAIRDLYNAFVACLYPAVNQFTEEFHEWRHASGPFYKISDEARFVNRVRDTLVLEDGDALWLAAGAPRRWFADAAGIQVDRVQTFFGPVSYRLRPGANAGTIEATVQLPSGHPPKVSWLVVRPPSGHISTVTVDGQAWSDIDRAIDAIRLPERPNQQMHLTVRYQ